MSGPTARTLLRTHAWIVYAFLYTPIVVLVVFSFNRASASSAAWRGFTTQWYAKLLQNESLRDAMLNSLIVGATATIASTLIGTAAAIGLHRLRRGKTVAATQGLVYLPIVIPDIVLGVALLTLFSLTRTQLSFATVILAHLAFCVSYVVIVVRARLAGIDPALEEAARDLGAGPIGIFLRVTLPLIAPGVAAAGLLVFIVSFDDYVITSLVSGSTSQTLPLKVYAMLRAEVTPEVNAACTVLLGLTVLLTTASQWILKRGNVSS